MTAVDSVKVDEFVSYCLGFYGQGGLYEEYNFTDEMIRDCTLWYVNSEEYLGKFCGDSVDREFVRDLVCRKYKISGVAQKSK